MEKQKSASLRWSSIERWTIDRLDRDARMARIETVPMRSDRLTYELLEALEKKGVQVGMDHVDLWDIENAETVQMSIEELGGQLGVRSNEMETLSENMVFWNLRGELEERNRVLHATQAARQLAKELYREVTRKEGPRYESK